MHIVCLRYLLCRTTTCLAGKHRCYGGKVKCKTNTLFIHDEVLPFSLSISLSRFVSHSAHFAWRLRVLNVSRHILVRFCPQSWYIHSRIENKPYLPTYTYIPFIHRRQNSINFQNDNFHDIGITQPYAIDNHSTLKPKRSRSNCNALMFLGTEAGSVSLFESDYYLLCASLPLKTGRKKSCLIIVKSNEVKRMRNAQSTWYNELPLFYSTNSIFLIFPTFNRVR